MEPALVQTVEALIGYNNDTLHQRFPLAPSYAGRSLILDNEESLLVMARDARNSVARIGRGAPLEVGDQPD
jgi:hypothetical protein